MQWACASIGAILVTLNPAYRLPELVRLNSLLRHCHISLITCFRPHSGQNAVLSRRITPLPRPPHPLFLLPHNVRRRLPLSYQLPTWIHTRTRSPAPEARGCGRQYPRVQGVSVVFGYDGVCCGLSGGVGVERERE